MGKAPTLVQALPGGPLDIVGDIHGEYEALINLLAHLGYDETGTHSEGRTLVFVGDYCDRGPDSPGVIALIQRLVSVGRALAILGNHELNLLIGEAKDGAGWYFDSRIEHDANRYAPYQRCSLEQRRQIHDFLNCLPVALERDDVRIVHATWSPDPIQALRHLPIGSVAHLHAEWEKAIEWQTQRDGLSMRIATERKAWSAGLENPAAQPPFMHAHAQYAVLKQMGNPLKVLTSGVERVARKPFYTGGRWRFAERVDWWNTYDERIPVVIGHYWRSAVETDRAAVSKGDADLFDAISPFAWHGRHDNVFCVDYSVGGRWHERRGVFRWGQGASWARFVGPSAF